MFSYYPFLVTYLNKRTPIGSDNIGILMMIGVISGSLLSLFSLFTLKIKDQSIGLIFSLTMFSLSLFLMGFISTLDLYILIVIGVSLSIFIYRYAIGLYFTFSRSLQINCLSTQNQKSLLFTRIKLVNSVGGAIGPLIGQYIINNYGYDYLFFTTSSLFLLCALIILLLRLLIPSRNVKISMISNAKKKPKKFMATITNELVKNPKFRYLTIGAMLHFTFEAQLYTFISLNIDRAGIKNSIGMIFSLNSIILITMAIIAGYVLTKISANEVSRCLIFFGSSMSCFAIILSTQATNMIWLAIIVMLFSIGEFITPQTCLDIITDTDRPITQRLAIYNFFTSSLGMGIGFFIGGILFSQANTLLSMLVWIIILIGIVICFYISEQHEEVHIEDQ